MHGIVHAVGARAEGLEQRLATSVKERAVARDLEVVNLRVRSRLSDILVELGLVKVSWNVQLLRRRVASRLHRYGLDSALPQSVGWCLSQLLLGVHVDFAVGVGLDHGEIGLEGRVVALHVQILLGVEVAARALDRVEGQVHGILTRVDVGGRALLHGLVVVLGVQVVVDVVFVVALHVAWEELAKQPQTLLRLRLVRPQLTPFSVFVVKMTVIERDERLVFIWIVHEIDQVRVIVLDGVSLLEDVLLTLWSILLMLLDHFLVALSRRVVMRDLRLDTNDGSRVFCATLLIILIEMGDELLVPLGLIQD